MKIIKSVIFFIYLNGLLEFLRYLKFRYIKNIYNFNFTKWFNEYHLLNKHQTFFLKKLICSDQQKIKFVFYCEPSSDLKILKNGLLKSLKMQIFNNWILILLVRPNVKIDLDELDDTRIELYTLTDKISLKFTDSFFTFLPEDSKLYEHSLYTVANKIIYNQELALIYSDEIKTNNTGQEVILKTVYDPYLILTHNYIGDFCFFNSNLITEALEYFNNYYSAQWNFCLSIYSKLTQKNVLNISKILYQGNLSSYNHNFFKFNHRILKKFNKNKLFNDFKINRSTKYFNLFWSNSDIPKITIIIPTRDNLKYLRITIESILSNTDYSNYEILLIDNNSEKEETKLYFEKLKKIDRIRILVDTSPFNFSKINNAAVDYSNSKILIFLNNDIKIISKNWLSEVSSLCLQPNVGAVGGKMIYENDTIQHAGIVLGFRNSVEHYHKNLSKINDGYLGRLNTLRSCSAVTGAFLAIERRKFIENSGFDEENLKISLNDVDLCLKLINKGYYNIYNPNIVMYHFESKSRGYEDNFNKVKRYKKEKDFLFKKWRNFILNDPYFNPNISLYSLNFELADPPRNGFLFNELLKDIKNIGK